MRLVLDTNIIVSALIKESVTREILVHDEIECLIPEFALQELEKHKEHILKKAGLSPEDFRLLLEELESRLTVIPESEISHREEAKRIMDKIDPEDTAFIALALSTRNDGIWSQDKHFEKQTVVKVWKTNDLINYLGITHSFKA